MSLLAWFPFCRDGENKGITNNNFSVDSSLFKDGGKIGKYLYVENKEYSVTVPGMSKSKHISVSFWFKELKETVSAWNDFVSLKSYYDDGTKIVNGEDVRLENYTKSGTTDIGATWYSSTFNTNYPTQTGALGIGGYTISYNTWHHMILMVDFENHTWTCIKDGNDKRSSAINPNAKYFLDTISVGDSAMICGINDLRVYDHLLSTREIKEILRAKVLHYDLASSHKYDNLLKNSRTFNSTNWTGSGTRNQNAFLDTFYSMSYTNINGDTTTYKDIAQQAGIIGKLGATYTLTCWVRGSGKFIAYFYGPSGYIQCAKSESSQGKSYTNRSDGNTDVDLSNVWQKIWIKWTLKDTGDETITKNLLFRLYGGNNLEIAMPKLILGNNKNTPWSPNPADDEYITLGYNNVTVSDQSGMGNDGEGVDISIEGYFNGTTSSINKILNPLKTADSFSIATWFYFENSSTFTFCTARTGTGVGLALFYIGGKLRLDDGNLQTTFSYSVPLNQWVHIVVTRSTTAKSLYVNGVLYETKNEVGDLSSPGNYMSIGSSCYSNEGVGSANYMKGYYKDFKLYSSTLNGTDVAELYSTRAQIDEDNNMYSNGLLIEEYDKSYVSIDGVNTNIISEKLDTYDMKLDTLNDGSVWARIFYHNNKAKTVLFKTVDECRNTQTEDKYSRLYLIDNFRGSDGKFEFMIKYPNNSTGYNRWKQSNNPCNEYWPHTADVYETVEGYEPISISWTASNWGGLCRQNENPTTLSSCYLSGSVGHSNWFYSIGAANTHYDGIPTWNGSTDSVVELWIRIDNAFINRDNLIPTNSDDWEQGSINSLTGEIYNDSSIYNQRIRMKDFGVLNPEGELHRIFISNQTDNEYTIGNITYYDENKTYIKTEKDISGQINFKDLVISPPTNARYYKAIMRNGESGDILPAAVTVAKPVLFKLDNICPINSSYWESGHYAVENGQKQDQGARIRLIDYLPVESGKTYYFNTYLSPYAFVIREMDSNKSFVKSLGGVPNGSAITLQSKTKYLAVGIYNSSTESGISSSIVSALLDNLTLKPLICLNDKITRTFKDYNKETQSLSKIPKIGNNFINIKCISEI